MSVEEKDRWCCNIAQRGGTVVVADKQRSKEGKKEGRKEGRKEGSVVDGGGRRARGTG